MWPFCGAEHYADDGPTARWRVGYRRKNRISGERGLDLDRWTWQRKRRVWRPFHLVAPTKWLARSVVRSVEIPADEPRVEWADIPPGAKRAEAILTYHFLFPAYIPALEARQVDLSDHRPKVLARAEATLR